MIFALFLVNYIYNLAVGELNKYPLQYFLAGFAGVLTVWLVGLMGASPLVRDVQIIQTVFIGIHFYGFLIYMFGLDPDSYEAIQTLTAWFQFLWILFARYDVRRHRLYHYWSDKLFHVNFNLRMPFCWKTKR